MEKKLTETLLENLRTGKILMFSSKNKRQEKTKTGHRKTVLPTMGMHQYIALIAEMWTQKEYLLQYLPYHVKYIKQ